MSGNYALLGLLCAISLLVSLQLTSPMLEFGLTTCGLTGRLQSQDIPSNVDLVVSFSSLVASCTTSLWLMAQRKTCESRELERGPHKEFQRRAVSVVRQ